MNHPRRVRLRHLLLLVPLALLGVTLLGAALLVRSRLPRPQTEGDKWLWEQAENAPFLTIIFGDAGKAVLQQAGLSYHPSEFHTDLGTLLEVKDRQGMRNVLHALEGTPAFSSGKAPFNGVKALNAASTVQIMIEHGEILAVTQEPRGTYVYLERSHRFAPVSPRAAAHLREVVCEALNKGKAQEDGYKLHLLTASQRQKVDSGLRASPP